MSSRRSKATSPQRGKSPAPPSPARAASPARVASPAPKAAPKRAKTPKKEPARAQSPAPVAPTPQSPPKSAGKKTPVAAAVATGHELDVLSGAIWLIYLYAVWVLPTPAEANLSLTAGVWIALAVGTINAAHEAALPQITHAVDVINENAKHLVEPLLLCGFFHSFILSKLPAFLAFFSATQVENVFCAQNNFGFLLLAVLIGTHHFAAKHRDIVHKVWAVITTLALLYSTYTQATGYSHKTAGLVVAALAYTGIHFYSPPVNAQVKLLINVATHVAMYHALAMVTAAATACTGSKPAAA